MEVQNMNLEAAREGLEIATALVEVYQGLKDSEESKTLRRGLRDIALDLKPLIEALDHFFVQLDIAAIGQMEAAGMSTETAIALRRGSGNRAAIVEGTIRAVLNDLEA